MTRRPSVLAVLKRPLGEVLAALPPREVHRAGLGECLGCAIAPFETLADAVRILGLDAAKVARAVGAALEQQGGR